MTLSLQRAALLKPDPSTLPQHITPVSTRTMMLRKTGELVWLLASERLDEAAEEISLHVLRYDRRRLWMKPPEPRRYPRTWTLGAVWGRPAPWESVESLSAALRADFSILLERSNTLPEDVLVKGDFLTFRKSAHL